MAHHIHALDVRRTPQRGWLVAEGAGALVHEQILTHGNKVIHRQGTQINLPLHWSFALHLGQQLGHRGKHQGQPQAETDCLGKDIHAAPPSEAATGLACLVPLRLATQNMNSTNSRNNTVTMVIILPA